MQTLAEIAVRYDTDKSAHAHYLANYERYFGEFRKQHLTLLELGVKAGGSLLLWRDYFPRGRIIGLDITPVELEDPSHRVRAYQGAQEDTGLLDRLAAESAPEGFDIIIDDCSHVGALTRASFWHLFDKHLKSGGLYAIEDWGTGYWENWIDGIAYRPQIDHASLHRLTMSIANLQDKQIFSRRPLALKLLLLVKRFVIRAQFTRHNYGMVGFVKELIDEVAMADITRPHLGTDEPRQSKIAELVVSQGHVFVRKR